MTSSGENSANCASIEATGDRRGLRLWFGAHRPGKPTVESQVEKEFVGWGHLAKRVPNKAVKLHKFV